MAKDSVYRRKRLRLAVGGGVLLLFFTGTILGIILLTRGSQRRSKDEQSEEFLRGIEAYKKKDFDSAISWYSKALEKDPNSAKAYRNRGWINHEKAKSLPDGDPRRQELEQAALQDLTKADKLNPSVGGFPLAQYYLDHRDWLSVIVACDHVIAAGTHLDVKEIAAVFDLRGTAYMGLAVLCGESNKMAALKHSRQAVKDVRKAAELDPSWKDSLRIAEESLRDREEHARKMQLLMGDD